MKKLLFLAVSLMAVVGHGGNDVGNGGDAVICRPSAKNDLKGYYSLDYLAHYKEEVPVVPVADLNASLQRILKGLEEKLPQLRPSFQDFVDTLFNEDNLALKRIWEKSTFGLIDLKDERFTSAVPENCLNETGNVSIVQAVIRVNPATSGYPEDKILYRYVPEVVAELKKTNALQLSFLLVHEWLWDHSGNVERNRRVNYLLHSQRLEQWSSTEWEHNLRQMGFDLHDAGNPKVVNVQSIPGFYWKDMFSFDGDRLIGPHITELNSSVMVLRAQTYPLYPGGIGTGSVINTPYSIDAVARVGGGLVLASRDHEFWDEALKKIPFRLYDTMPDRRKFVTQQMAADSRGYLYVLGYGYQSGQQNDVGAWVQIVNTKNSEWEQTLTLDSLINMPKHHYDTRARIAVTGNYLLLTDPRTITGTDNEGKPLPHGPFIYVFDVSDPYSPKQLHRLKLKVKVNALNLWTPIVNGTTLYVPNENTLTAYDLKTGMELGEIILPEAMITHGKPHAVFGETLYVASKFRVYALDIADPRRMRKLWDIRIANPEARQISHVHRVGDKLYVIWQDKNYGNGKTEGVRITTVSLVQ